MPDALNRFVDERDRAFSDKKVLDRNKRQRVDRRVCRACWRTLLPRRFTPGLQDCPWCGGKLYEVTL